MEMVCRTVGDTAGFDVRSFDECTFEEMHIEVKASFGPQTTPFFMSAAEVDYAKTCAQRYVIYRLYEYSKVSAKIQFSAIEKPVETLESRRLSFGCVRSSEEHGVHKWTAPMRFLVGDDST